MDNVLKHAEEEREQIIERKLYTNQMEEITVPVQLLRRKIATPSHVQLVTNLISHILLTPKIMFNLVRNNETNFYIVL